MSKKPDTEREVKVPVKQRAASFSPPLKYKIISDEEIDLTKEKAFAFLELKQFQGEREVRERHVQFLFDEWSANRFLWQNIIIASAKVAGENVEYRINGQHTCWMRVNVPERYEPIPCKVRVTCYQVDSEEQLRTLYSVFDRGAPRTVGHIGKVLLLGTQAADGIPPGIHSLLIAGFKLFWSPTKWKREQMAINDWCGIIESNYGTLFNVVGRFFSQQTEAMKLFKRASVSAALFSTFEKSVEGSIEFWTPVFNGINLQSKTDPRYKLREYLTTHGHSVVGGLTKVGQDEMLWTCVQLWNHWRDGKTVSVVKPLHERPKAR